MAVYHIELRQFPHGFSRFNLSEGELNAILIPWAREEWIELGERKWSPHEAKLRVIEGEREIPLERLSMGRGWRVAEREGREVTERVVEAARALGSAGPPGVAHAPGAAREGSPPGAPSSLGAPRGAVTAEALGLEILGLLGAGEIPLRRAWELAGARDPSLAPSAALGLAEAAISSLLRTALIVLVRRDPPEVEGGPIGPEEIGPALARIESWAGRAAPAGAGGHAEAGPAEADEGSRSGVWIRRA
jgi:hypothetical protein